MAWHPHTECPPPGPMSALIAVRDTDGYHHLMAGLFMRENNQWVSESDSSLVPPDAFFWQNERDLLVDLDPE